MKNRKSAFLTTIFFVFTISVILSLICHFYLDKPIAFWVANNHYLPRHLLKPISEIPKVFDAVTALSVFIVYIFSWIMGEVPLLLKNLTLASIALVITDFWVEWSKYIFGRFWPLTWVNNNPSLIDTNEYGFHFFYSTGDAYKSFPSAHTALTIAAVTFLALRYPSLRIPAILVSVAVPLSLVALNYHFLGDTIAGAGLGWMVAYSLDTINQNNHLTQDL